MPMNKSAATNPIQAPREIPIIKSTISNIDSDLKTHLSFLPFNSEKDKVKIKGKTTTKYAARSLGEQNGPVTRELKRERWRNKSNFRKYWMLASIPIIPAEINIVVKIFLSFLRSFIASIMIKYKSAYSAVLRVKDCRLKGK
jgi:hypothetical protein